MVGIWAAAAILGLVEAPAIVIAAGIVAFIVVGVGAAAAARAFRRMAQPLDELIAASARIEAGDYTVRVPIEGSGEMRSLARAFNQMSEQLQASDTRRRAFLADVTHELRTPLTVMQGQLEAIEDGVYEPDGPRISALLSHARQMSGLVEDLHTISLAEVGGLRLELIAADVAVVADEVVAAYASAAGLAGVALTARHDGRTMALLDPAAIRRVLGNLVANALRHTDRGGHVSIEVIGTDETVALQVRDDGSGMASELAEHVFERFEKGPDSDGSGLGLAIARDLVEAQHGTIELRSDVGAGTVLTITLLVPDR